MLLFHSNSFGFHIIRHIHIMVTSNGTPYYRAFFKIIVLCISGTTKSGTKQFTSPINLQSYIFLRYLLGNRNRFIVSTAPMIPVLYQLKTGDTCSILYNCDFTVYQISLNYRSWINNC